MIDPISTAAEWLDRTYGGVVTVADPNPVAEGANSWLVACRRTTGRGEPVEPMLAATVVVPKSGRPPFPAANADPFNEQLNLAGGADAPGIESWRWRVNARNCVVATDAAVHRHPSSALPWYPTDESPNWWSRLLADHFPDAEQSTHAGWAEVQSAIIAGGPGTCGVVWLRRRFRGVEVTGHLLYAQYFNGSAVVIDGQLGMPAVLNDAEVEQLVLARFHRQDDDAEPALVPPWRIAATDLDSAVLKAQRWLDATYDGEVALVSPDATDRLRRGWLFACTTKRFARTGDWRDQMLDAALVVPVAADEDPFGLPNLNPWGWLEQWDQGAANLPAPPDSGAAAWYEPTMRELGPVLGTEHYRAWPDVLSHVAGLPPNASAVVWLRRVDRRGRETVGNLMLAVNEQGSVRLVDSRHPDTEPALESSPLGMHVVRYR